jgi:hypothetical protein
MANPQLSTADVTTIVQRYAANWNNEHKEMPLWVILANPGDTVNVPGRSFGTVEAPVGGMCIAIRAQVIVLNMQMVPESLLSTFFHEYGHARYNLEHPQHEVDVVASELAAIRYSLEALASEGYPELAHREAQCILDMAVAEPYKSAVAVLSSDPIWRTAIASE